MIMTKGDWVGGGNRPVTDIFFPNSIGILLDELRRIEAEFCRDFSVASRRPIIDMSLVMAVFKSCALPFRDKFNY